MVPFGHSAENSEESELIMKAFLVRSQFVLGLKVDWERSAAQAGVGFSRFSS